MRALSSFLAIRAEAVEQKLVTGDFEACKLFEVRQAGFDFTGMHFYRATAGFALQMVVVNPRAATYETHGLVGT